MRLLRTEGTELRLDEFLSVESTPPYACLSHRWQGEEVTFQNLQDPRFEPQTKDLQRSWQKVLNARRAALQLGYGYIWIDSCCIDQKSSAELTESINSMYTWYERSAYCIAYLADDSGSPGSFRRSQWWLRGWTLQELLAPKELMFYDATWTPRITRFCAARVIEEITGIEQAVLQRPSREALRKVCAATKLSWASSRATSKVEDRAYSLLGLFEIQLPIFYGEGMEQALWRLQLEIYRSTSDYTIFVWEDEDATSNRRDKGLIATQLEHFALHRRSGGPKLRRRAYSPPDFSLDEAVPVAQNHSDRVHGLRVQFLIKPKHTWRDGAEFNSGQLVLPCFYLNDTRDFVMIHVLVVNGTRLFRWPGREALAGEDWRGLRDSKDLRRFDMFFTSFLQDYRLPELKDHTGLYLSRVVVSDASAMSCKGLGLSRSNSSSQSGQAWETMLEVGGHFEWSYFEEFEGSLSIVISSPRRPDSSERPFTIAIKIDRWRLLNLDLAASTSRDQPTITPRAIEDGVTIEEFPQTRSVPWVDGRRFRITFRKIKDVQSAYDYIICVGLEVEDQRHDSPNSHDQRP